MTIYTLPELPAFHHSGSPILFPYTIPLAFSICAALPCLFPLCERAWAWAAQHHAGHRHCALLPSHGCRGAPQPLLHHSRCAPCSQVWRVCPFRSFLHRLVRLAVVIVLTWPLQSASSSLIVSSWTSASTLSASSITIWLTVPFSFVQKHCHTVPSCLGLTFHHAQMVLFTNPRRCSWHDTWGCAHWVPKRHAESIRRKEGRRWKDGGACRHTRAPQRAHILQLYKVHCCGSTSI